MSAPWHEAWDRAIPWPLLSDLFSAPAQQAGLDVPPYPTWGSAEQAAWSRFDVQYFRPVTGPPTPVVAIFMLLLFAFGFLAFWGYSFLAYSRKRLVTAALEPPQQVAVPEDSRSMACYVMCGSLEHSLPHLHRGKAIAGGLGKVMDLVSRHHPTRLTMVHPMLRQDERLDYQINEQDEEEPLRLRVDGVIEHVRVFWQAGAPSGGPGGPEVDFLLLSHPLFEARTQESIYPSPMTRRRVLRFYSLWNQAMAALVVRRRPDLLHTPDFHTAVAPWYAIRDCPWLRIVLVLHNAEYQGSMSTSMLWGERLRKVADIWNLPPALVARHLVFEGRFNMLKSGIDFVMEKQRGRGVYAVSSHYAKEVTATYSLLWRIRRVGGLDNPMLEEERAQLTDSLAETKRRAKLEVQRQFGLAEDLEARIFVSLGRLVRQKGVDLIADVADWLLSNPAFPKAQLIVIGPVADGYGVYAKERLLVTAARPEFAGRLFVRPEFMSVSSDLKFAADFCLMPSRDEPFGYVDIEFAWHGALMVGAEAGGLGKVPGFYYIAQNRENLGHLRERLRVAIAEAMEATPRQLEEMAGQALRCTFPLDQWQAKLTAAYRDIFIGSPSTQAPASAPTPAAAAAACSDIELRGGGAGTTANPTFTPYHEEVRRAHRRAELVAVVTRAPALLEDMLMAPLRQHREAARRQPLLSFQQEPAFDEVQDEFLVQELSEEELAVRVQAKVWEHPAMYIDDMVEKIGTEVDFEREAEGSMQRWLLGKTFGQARIHLLVICGYLAGPLADAVIIGFATEWSMRYGAITGPLRWDSTTMLCAIFMVCSSIAYLLGAIAWAALTKYVPPRVVMAGNLLLHFACVLAAFVMRGSFQLACSLVFFHGLVTAGSLLFLAFSFMMSIKADLSVAAIRMGVIEIIRYAIIWTPVSFLLLLSPTSFAGTKEDPMPTSVKWVMFPLGLLVTAMTLVPGVLLLFAPGPYRDDRFPGWEVPLIFKRWSFVILGCSDCLAGLYLFPSLSYLTWWLAQGWTEHEVAGLGLLIVLLLGGGFAGWALALSEASKHSLAFLGGAAALLAPPVMIRAVALGEASTPRIEGKSAWTLLLCVATLLLEGIRQSAQWTAKIKILNSRWRLLSYGSVLLSFQSFFSLLSPLATFSVAMGLPNLLWVGTTDPKSMADLGMITIVPVGVLVALVQAAAGPFILQDLGVPKKPGGFRRGYAVRCLTSPAVVALAIAFMLISLLRRDFYALIARPMVFEPTYRCPGEWTAREVQELGSRCTPVASERGGAFERNANGQITTARYNCLQLMQHRGGNTFALVAGPGEEDNECRVLGCAGDLSAGREPSGVDAPWDQDLEVWSRTCPQTKTGRNLVGTHLMEWNWTDIGEECESRLGPEGWSFVQVSPPTEHILGHSWDVKYQPVSAKLDSRSGSEAEFREMVRKCREAGVSVLVDFIVNHFATSIPPKGMERVINDTNDPECGINYNCRGWNGTWYGSREFGGEDEDPRMNKFRRNHFHHYIGNDRSNCGLDTFATTAKPAAVNLFNDMALCDMSGCTDMHTELPETQNKIQRYLLRLTDAGVTMLRVDAAPALYSQSLATILEPFPWEYVFQEVLMANFTTGLTAPGKFADVPSRLKISSILDYTYGSEMYEVLLAGRPRFGTLPQWMASTRTEVRMIPPSDHCLLFIDNHDSQRAGGRATYRMGLGYRAVQHFALVYPWANALRLMSGYYFEDSALGHKWGPPGVGDGLVGYPSKVECRPPPDTYPANESWLRQRPDWICEHRWPGVGPLVRLRRLLGQGHAPGDVFQDQGLGAFSFSLGGLAFFAFTMPSSGPAPPRPDGWSLVGRRAGLAAGTYCNVASITGRLPRPAEWPSSGERQRCGSEQHVEVDAAGRIVRGFATRGHAVAIHVSYGA